MCLMGNVVVNALFLGKVPRVNRRLCVRVAQGSVVSGLHPQHAYVTTDFGVPQGQRRVDRGVSREGGAVSVRKLK